MLYMINFPFWSERTPRLNRMRELSLDKSFSSNSPPHLISTGQELQIKMKGLFIQSLHHILAREVSIEQHSTQIRVFLQKLQKFGNKAYKLFSLYKILRSSVLQKNKILSSVINVCQARHHTNLGQITKHLEFLFNCL